MPVRLAAVDGVAPSERLGVRVVSSDCVAVRVGAVVGVPCNVTLRVRVGPGEAVKCAVRELVREAVVLRRRKRNLDTVWLADRVRVGTPTSAGSVVQQYRAPYSLCTSLRQSSPMHIPRAAEPYGHRAPAERIDSQLQRPAANLDLCAFRQEMSTPQPLQ